MMITRVLPPAEWHRLVETELDMTVWGAVAPTSAEIVVVEHGGRIVACWGTFAVRHVEGFWLHPAYRRRGGVLRSLFQGMRTVLKRLGATVVVTSAEQPSIVALLEKAGATAIPGTSYQLPVDFGPWRKET